jgi:hypothetical protein
MSLAEKDEQFAHMLTERLRSYSAHRVIEFLDSNRFIRTFLHKYQPAFVVAYYHIYVPDAPFAPGRIPHGSMRHAIDKVFGAAPDYSSAA